MIKTVNFGNRMMKIQLTLLFLLISICSYSQGEDDTHSIIQQRFQCRKIISKYELVFGGGLLKNSGYMMADMVPKYGYSYGVGVYHTFAKRFDLNVRATFDLKGSKVDYSGIAGNSTGTVTFPYNKKINSNFNYLTITVLPTFYIGPKGNILVGAGGFYSFLRHADVKQVDNATGTVMTRYIADKDNFPDKTDAGICAFVGYSFKFIHKSMGTVQLFYNRSIDDVADPIDGYQRHKSFMLMFSLGIPN